MDRIIESLVSEFKSDNSLDKLELSQAYEHFSGYVITSQHYAESFDTKEIVVGDGGDCGIDCISVIVNGYIVTDVDEVDDIAKSCDCLDVTFILVQTETSSSFDTSKIGQFCYGVKDLFDRRHQLKRNDNIKRYDKIIDKIISLSGKFRRGNPRCLMYYVTTGTWKEDCDLVARRDSEKNDIFKLNIFREVNFQCIGAEEIRKLYQDTKNARTVEVNFPVRTVLPEIKGVEQAYIGVMEGTEYLKIIENDEKEIISTLFFDNVRDWQQWNPVNKEIRDTIISNDKKVHFSLLNNGITIVAKKITLVGNKFTIDDYQIVNGCQTSYTLHECHSSIDQNVLIPVRLISTGDADIRNAIIKATNRQTAVNDDQFIALLEFPKKLESFFAAYSGLQRIYYERRSKQYAQAKDVEKVRVVDQRSLIRAFVSMFLDLPHRTTRDYRSLCHSKIGEEIFNKDHKLESYYASAYAAYKLEGMFRSGTIEADLKPARYHILMALRYMCMGSAISQLNSNALVKEINKFLEVLWDDSKARLQFTNAAKLVRKVANGNLDGDNIRVESFTRAIRSELLLRKTV